MKNIGAKKYDVYCVEQVTGKSEDSIRGYFNNKNISTKGGITVEQIIDFLENNTFRSRRKQADLEEVRELRSALRALGYVGDDEVL